MGKVLNRGKCSDNGINPKAVYEFLQNVEKEDYGIDSFMLIKDGVVVAEGYHPPYTNSDSHVLYSLSKSMTSIALGFAVEEGLVSLDDSISKFFPEYDKLGFNKNIKVRHLVTMTSGKMIGMAKNRHGKDWIKIFFDAPFFAKPGSKFFYLNDNFYLLSAIISKASGQTLVDFLEPRLFEPLGIEKPIWETDKFGYAAGGWGLYMDIESLAKIMLCYANMGEWDGKQVISADWIKQSTAFQVNSVKRGHIDGTKGYGYGFWQTSLPHTYRAYGLCGQFGYVFKDKNTVLVINSGISRDEIISDAVNEMYQTLWDEPETEYEEKLREALACMGDKDFLPAMPRNTYLEQKYDKKTLRTRSTGFASMLHATMTTVIDEPLGKSDRFSLSLDKDNNLYMTWEEGAYLNRIRLGMDNVYEKTAIKLGEITYTACTKAAWTKEKVLTVLVRISEGCHVRRLEFDFTDEKHIVIRNDSYPDMPRLAAHYMDFSGMPLPQKLEDLLVKYVAPGVLLIGEPNYRVKRA
ncbi:MAG: serine hydrolase domain-containing protein [Acutalibacteraceae bacterium]